MSLVSPRATAMSPDERRRSILQAVVPLLAERGAEVSTREIAEAAGIAEGTIFRVFEDKRCLMLAAAKEAIDPEGGEELFEAAMAEAGDLREKVVLAAARVQERMRLTMAVMMGVRSHLVAEHHAHQPDADDRGRVGPPRFVLEAQEALHKRLTGLFTPYAGQLAFAPEQAALALRSLVFGSSRTELGLQPSLTPEEIADVLLDGILRREG